MGPMVRPNLLRTMRRVSELAVVLFAVGLLFGCEPTPSTPLAPDKPMPDASKMSSQDIDKLLQKNHEEGRH